MKQFRIAINVVINAHDPDQALRRTMLLYGDLEGRPWIVEVLPDSIVERIPNDQTGDEH